MAKIKFNIKYRPEIETGKYQVTTEEGIPVSILKWDLNGRYPILGVTMVECCNYEGDESWGEERPIAYNIEGEPVGYVPAARKSLVIVTDDSELTEFEQELIKVMKEEGSPIGADTSKYTEGDIATIHSYSERLLALARKQLQPEIDAEIDKAYKNSDAVQYRRGKEDALKELYCNRDDYKEAVSEKIRNMVSKLFTGDGNITSKAFADEFAWELLTLARAETFKDIPNWQITEEGEQYNICLTRWLDVNGDYQYELSHGHLAAGMEYLPISKLAKLKIEK